MENIRDNIEYVLSNAYLKLITILQKNISRVVFLSISLFFILIIENSHLSIKVNNLQKQNEELYLVTQDLSKVIESHKPYKRLISQINNWCIDEEYQQLMYFFANRYSIDYKLLLSICYAEGTRNNPKATNGHDYGIMQINESNRIGLIELTGSDNLEQLYEPQINICMAAYIIHNIFKLETIYENEDVYWWVCVYYNGGIEQVKNIKSGFYTRNCKAGTYATKCMRIYNILDKEYMTGHVDHLSIN